MLETDVGAQSERPFGLIDHRARELEKAILVRIQQLRLVVPRSRRRIHLVVDGSLFVVSGEVGHRLVVWARCGSPPTSRSPMWRGRSSSTSGCGPTRSPPCGPRRRPSPSSCSLKPEPHPPPWRRFLRRRPRRVRSGRFRPFDPDQTGVRCASADEWASCSAGPDPKSGLHLPVRLKPRGLSVVAALDLEGGRYVGAQRVSLRPSDAKLQHLVFALATHCPRRGEDSHANNPQVHCPRH